MKTTSTVKYIPKRELSLDKLWWNVKHSGVVKIQAI